MHGGHGHGHGHGHVHGHDLGHGDCQEPYALAPCHALGWTALLPRGVSAVAGSTNSCGDVGTPKPQFMCVAVGTSKALHTADAVRE